MRRTAGGTEGSGTSGSTGTGRRPGEDEIDEKLSTFLMLAAGAVLIFIACLLLGWYLTKPRIDQISPVLSSLIGWSAIVLAADRRYPSRLETTLLLKFRKSLFPYIWRRSSCCLFSRKACGSEEAGISKDRVGNSFIRPTTW